MLSERLEHVDARDEQIVTLVLEAVRRPQSIERAAHPLLAGLGPLGHDTQFAIKKAHALTHGQLIARHGIVARAHERRFTARNLKPRSLHIGMPTVTLLASRKLDGIGDGSPRMILGVLDVEDVTFAEPHLIKVVIHLITQP